MSSELAKQKRLTYNKKVCYIRRGNEPQISATNTKAFRRTQIGKPFSIQPNRRSNDKEKYIQQSTRKAVEGPFFIGGNRKPISNNPMLLPNRILPQNRGNYAPVQSHGPSGLYGNSFHSL
jgi:hypothetical protein